MDTMYTAIGSPSHGCHALVLRGERARLLEDLRLGQWKFDKHPTKAGALLCAGLRLRITEVEAQMVGLDD